jgi:DNA-binding transcriptional LysR family regulator
VVWDTAILDLIRQRIISSLKNVFFAIIEGSMDRLKGFEVLVAIVDSGGFGRAAERLSMSPAMVSSHLARLEDRLRTQLIHRSTRRFALTPEGHQFVEEARGILEAVARAEDGVRRGMAGPSGRVYIDAPGAIGLRFVVPALSALRERHPRIALDLSVGDRNLVFRPESFDLLIRVGEPPAGKMDVITVGSTRFVQVASPEYLERRGVPKTPDEIEDHDAILYATLERPVGQRWRFWRDGEIHWLRPPSVATFNHGDAIAAAAVAGVGIAQTLEMLVATELASGRLIAILDEWNCNPVDIHLVVPDARSRRPAVRAVADFLRDNVDWSNARRVADGASQEGPPA